MKKKILTVLLVVAMLITCFLGYQGKIEAKTCKLGKTYTLKGKLRYTSWRLPGAYYKHKGYVLRLKKKVKIKGEGKIKDIDILPVSPKIMKKLKKKKGKTIKVKGKIRYAETAGYLTNYLIEVKKIK